MTATKVSPRLNVLLIAVYGVFALAASARAAYQIATKFADAPLAYSLSALSGLIYVIATVALVRRNERLAKLTIQIELVGVVLIGLLSLLMPEVFRHPSVWSEFGIGYGFVPLVLPIWGLWWLARGRK
jgi:cytochrome bd-type quinol oxidase subunit 2